MKERIENILDQSLKGLHKGSLAEEAISASPEEHKEELLSLLKVAKSLAELPKKSIPEPVMQKKFILLPVKTFWFSALRLTKLATVSISIMLLITVVAGTGYAAMSSVPGQTLFAIKKSAEQLQVKLTRNPQAKISLQLEISKKRLSEAEKVLKNPSVEPSQTKAVINELVAQTQNTVEEVRKVTKTDLNLQKTQPIVKSLEKLALEQQQLIKEIKPVNEQTMVTNAEKATQEATTKLAEIKKYIQAATSEQALVELDNNKEEAKPEEVAGGVEGANTEPNENTVATSTKPTASSTTQSVENTEKPEVIEKDPNTVIGTFIIEDPSPINQSKP